MTNNNTKTLLHAEPPVGSKAYVHLQPLVDCLITHDNQPFHPFGWGRDKRSLIFFVKDPIDFDLVETLFELPESVLLLRERNMIYCGTTQARIAYKPPERNGGAE